MGEEIKITPEERLWLINEVMNAEGFHGLLERIENKLNINDSRNASQIVNHSDISPKTENIENRNISEETSVATPNNKTYNYVEDSGMYEKDVLHLVAAEFGSNLNGKPLNVDEQVEAPSNQVKPVEISTPSQTPEQKVIEDSTENQETKTEKPLTKIRELEKNNPWSSARTVVPGEIKLI